MQKSINTENIPNEFLWNLTLLGPMGQIRPIICLSQWTKNAFYVFFNSVQFSSVAQSCLTLCNPMGCSTQTPGVYSHYLAQANQYSLSSSYSHWFRDGHMTQDSQSRLRGISRDFVGTFGEMGFSTPTTPRLGVVITGRRSNWAEAEDGERKQSQRWRNDNASS